MKPPRLSRRAGVGAISALVVASALLVPRSTSSAAATATGDAADCETVAPLASTATMTAGTAQGTKYTYQLPDGSVATTVVPPASFSPATATVAQDVAFGYNPPSDAAGLAAWRASWSGYKGSIASVPCVATGRVGTVGTSAAQSSAATSATGDVRAATSTNWGGFVATGHSNFSEISGNIEVPDYSYTCDIPNSNTMASPWIGIGGYNTGRLIQEGFDAGSTANLADGARLWYEYLNAGNQNPLVYIGNTTVTGSDIHLDMTVSSGSTTFTWFNETTGYSWTPITMNTSGYYDGSSAEAIVEYPIGYNAFRRFSQEHFRSLIVGNGSNYDFFFSEPSTTRILLTRRGTQFASMTDPSIGSFNLNWLNCQA